MAEKPVMAIRRNGFVFGTVTHLVTMLFLLLSLCVLNWHRFAGTLSLDLATLDLLKGRGAQEHLRTADQLMPADERVASLIVWDSLQGGVSMSVIEPWHLQSGGRRGLVEHWIGMVRFNQGDTLGAVRAWALIFPPSMLLDKVLIDVYAREQWQRALELSWAVLEVAPTNSTALQVYALAVYRVERDLDKAVAALEAAIALRPNNPAPQLALADVYAQAGQMNKAKFWLDRAKPLTSSAYVKEAVFLEREGRLGEARFLLEKTLARDPESSEVLIWLAKVSDEMGDFPTALVYYRRAAQLSKPYPFTAGIFGDWARAERRAGNTAEAIKGYRIVLQIKPDDKEAKQTLQELEHQTK